MATLTPNKGRISESSRSPAAALRVAVLRIYRALRIRADHHVTPSQGSALARIEQSEPVRIGVLANLEGISAASMSKIVDCLVDDGYVARVADPLDGRASVVQLTTGGREMIHAIRTASTEALEAALASLSESERSLLRRSLPVLEKVAEALQVRDVL
ncbi:MAG TPA: MarR family transcriptional regulator [Acidimicrobiales bacterium]